MSFESRILENNYSKLESYLLWIYQALDSPWCVSCIKRICGRTVLMHFISKIIFFLDQIKIFQGLVGASLDEEGFPMEGISHWAAKFQQNLAQKGFSINRWRGNTKFKPV